MELAPGLPDGAPPGGEGRQHQPQGAAEMWPVPEGPHSVLQEHHREHIVGLNHSLVRQLHRHGPQDSSESDTCS